LKDRAKLVAIMPRILAALVVAAALHAADPAGIRQAAADVTQSLGVQQQLPGDSARTAPAPPSSGRDTAVPGGGVELPGDSAPAPGAVWSLLQWTLIGLAIVAVVALAVSWILEARSARGAPLAPPGVPRPAGSPAPPAAEPDRLLALADEYAAAGRYTEAMHQVLLAAMAMLHARDSLTSWELLRAASLAPAARQALQTLIARVERAWFGRQPAGTADYQAARGSFRDFASASAGKV
jgi:hypothetical protein